MQLRSEDSRYVELDGNMRFWYNCEIPCGYFSASIFQSNQFRVLFLLWFSNYNLWFSKVVVLSVRQITAQGFSSFSMMHLRL